jgi:hypothetical protein
MERPFRRLPATGPAVLLNLARIRLGTIGSMRRLTRIRRLLTLHETRRAMVSAVRSGAAIDLARRVRSDRAGLLRDVRDPSTARTYLWAVARHPATHELAAVGMMALPSRYLRLGWVAARVATGLVRRHGTRRG